VTCEVNLFYYVTDRIAIYDVTTHR